MGSCFSCGRGGGRSGGGGGGGTSAYSDTRGTRYAYNVPQAQRIDYDPNNPPWRNNDSNAQDLDGQSGNAGNAENAGIPWPGRGDAL